MNKLCPDVYLIMFFLHCRRAEESEGRAPFPMVITTPNGTAALSFESDALCQIYLDLAGISTGWDCIDALELVDHNPAVIKNIQMRLHLSDISTVCLLRSDPKNFPYQQFMASAWSDDFIREANAHATMPQILIS
ncbi:MAG: hypothetical protein AAGA18_02600 [Verrucomicrobiota bacterium]